MMIDHGTRPVCVVTGAAGTLGTAFCRQYAKRYHIVAVWNSRRPTVPTQNQHLFDPLDPERPLRINTNPVYEVRTDLRQQAEIGRLIDDIVDQFGCVDVLLNLAVVSDWRSLLECGNAVDNATQAFRVNCAAPLALTSTIAREIWATEPRSNREANRNVVNLSSTAGAQVYSGYGQGVYSTTKAALNMLTRHLADELQPLGVRVNALAPDSFPSRVPISEVLAQMLHLIEGDMTGCIVEQRANRIDIRD
jgi:NAD(P)-dependent dehydrogenase (short-subunit alcohol dehydrogenase family)